MTREEKLRAIEEILELDEGTLTETSILAEFQEWDSLSKLALIAESGRIFGKAITGENIRSCVTVDDLLNL